VRQAGEAAADCREVAALFRVLREARRGVEMIADRSSYIFAAGVLFVFAVLELVARVDEAEKRLCSQGAQLHAMQRELAIARVNTRQLATARHKMQRRPPQRLTRSSKGS